MLCPRASRVLWDYIGWKFSWAQFLKAFRHSAMQVATTGILKIKLAAIHAYSFWWSKHQISLWQRRFPYSSIKIMLKTLPPMAMLWGFFLLFWVRTYFWHLHFHSCLPKTLWLVLLIPCAHEARLLTYHRCMWQPKKEVSRQRNKEGERKSPSNLYFPCIMPVRLVKWPSTGISKER